jgi:hypothetical protein
MMHDALPVKKDFLNEYPLVSDPTGTWWLLTIVATSIWSTDIYFGDYTGNTRSYNL